LVWDGNTGTIANGNAADINASINTIFTSLTSGDFLVYDGTVWRNRSKAALPVDGVTATTSAGFLIENNVGGDVARFGAGGGTQTEVLGALSVAGLTTHSAALNTAKGADIASATTTNIGAATGNFVHITGTTTITGLGTIAAGVIRIVRFAGALTLTHNGTSLILPSNTNITTAANDTAIFVSEGSGNWRCVSYQKSSDITTPWVAYTPANFNGFGTVTGVEFYSRRVGDTLEIRGKFTAGTTTGVEARIELGFNGTSGGITSAGSDKLPSGTSLAGMCAISVATAVTIHALIERSVGYLTFGIQTGAAAGLTKQNGTFISSGQTLSVQASVPMTGW
jgi:hypothetical protein